MIVQKKSVFPAGRDTVFQKLQQLETLQYIAKPYAAFEPVSDAVHIWTVDTRFLCTQAEKVDPAAKTEGDMSNERI